LQLGWHRHFCCIVVPAWQAYLDAERRLSVANRSGDGGAIEHASNEALREGGAASLYLHHFIEIVVNERPDFLPPEIIGMDDAGSRLGQTRKWLAESCFTGRSEKLCMDVELLRQVADALKHAALTRENLEVQANDAVLTTTRIWGQGRFGEGKFGGAPQVWILAKSGPRSLTTVLQNVIDAWRRKLGWSLPPPGQL